MLIKDTLDINKILWQNMIKGNFSRLTFVPNKQKYLIKCLYAPNKDSVKSDNVNESTKFFKEVFDDGNYEDFQNCILEGDYNVELEHDKQGCGKYFFSVTRTRDNLCEYVGTKLLF